MTSLLTPRMMDRLTRLDVNPRRAAGGGGSGDHAAGMAGVGSLFREHRPYAPGDDLRYVDWNAYGRLRSLNVKVFEKEENLDALALIDRSASMGEGPGSKLEVALRVVASLGAVGLARGAAARTHAFPDVRATKAMAARSVYRGRRDIDAFMRALESVPGGGAEPMGTALRSAFPRVRPRGVASCTGSGRARTRLPSRVAPMATPITSGNIQVVLIFADILSIAPGSHRDPSPPRDRQWAPTSVSRYVPHLRTRGDDKRGSLGQGRA